MLSAMTVAILVTAGLVALTTPILYLTYLGHVDETHAPRGGRAEPDPAD